ncbi:hypothetical protein FACS1894217_11330 [Clostridia bacterium]|nr:hypothetical protein FACS1894217_11330 [Clostridia bacterium]
MKKIFISVICYLLFVICAGCSANDSPTDPLTFAPYPTPATTPAVTQTPEPTLPPTPAPTPNPSATIQLTGDVLLHGRLMKAAKIGDTYDYTPYFEPIKPYVNADITVANMENPVDAFGNNENLSTYPRFNAPLEILDGVKFAGFNTLVTANNHAFDRAFDGLVASRKNIEDKGFNVTGTNGTQEQFDEYLILERNGLKIGIIAYSELDNGLSSLIPADKRAFAMRRFAIGSEEDLDKMAQDMAACREAGADMVVLSLHWGVEYADKPSAAAIAMARKLAERGADVVMGNHAHCVQPIEWWDTDSGRKLIIYSLGNFFVDQNALSPPIPKTQYGMIVKVKAEWDGARLSLDAEYLPTFMYKFTEGGKLKYLLMPADPNSSVSQKAYNHVTAIAGDSIPAASLSSLT